MKQNRWWVFAGLAWVLSAGILVPGCAKKAQPVTQENPQLAKIRADLKAKMANADKWMVTGQFQAVNAGWQDKINQALDKFEALTAFEASLFSGDHANSVEIQAACNGENFHLSVRRNQETEPWEGFGIQDRFYSQKGNDALQDNGPASRAQGEKLFRPLLTDLRISIKQAMHGEMKDVGLVDFNGKKVHRYDCRTQVPGTTPEVLTAAVDLDEATGMLVHALVGNGSGSESSSARFAKQYRELALERTEGVAPIQLPQGITVLPPEQDATSDKMELP